MDNDDIMTLTQGLLDQIHTFDAECAEAQYTDTEIAWDLLRNARDLCNILLDNPVELD